MCDYTSWCDNEPVAVIKVSVKAGMVACCERHAKDAICSRKYNIRAQRKYVAAKRKQGRNPFPVSIWFLTASDNVWRKKADYPNWEELAVTEEVAEEQRQQMRVNHEEYLASKESIWAK